MTYMYPQAQMYGMLKTRLHGFWPSNSPNSKQRNACRASTLPSPLKFVQILNIGEVSKKLQVYFARYLTHSFSTWRILPQKGLSTAWLPGAIVNQRTKPCRHEKSEIVNLTMKNVLLLSCMQNTTLLSLKKMTSRRLSELKS